MRTLAGSPLLCYTHLLGSWEDILVESRRRKEAMPKPATHVLRWSAENQCYVSQTLDQPPVSLSPADQEAWRAWLTTHGSFSFQGQQGHVNVLKEGRARGQGYWYAYHTHAGQSRKRYLGTD